MELQHYIDEIHRQFETAAAAGGEDTASLAEQLMAPLDAAIRLALLEALSEAAQQITCDLAPGSVQVRLLGRDPDFVVVMPSEPVAHYSPTGSGATDNDWPAVPHVGPSTGDEGGTSRINVRMPDHLKVRIEHAAADEGLSVNAWLVRVAAANLVRSDLSRRGAPRGPQGAQRVTGWVR
jgi:hypothetical protein